MLLFVKTCKECGSGFMAIGRAQQWCPDCGKDKTKLRKRAEDKRYKLREGGRSYKRHGVTTEMFKDLFVKGCAICKRSFTDSPHVDHDHRHCSGRFGCKDCFRGLLCKFCNNGFIYAIESNPELRKLVDPEVLVYIDKLKGNTA